MRVASLRLGIGKVQVSMAGFGAVAELAEAFPLYGWLRG